MSAISGLLRFDGAPPDRSLLEAMNDRAVVGEPSARRIVVSAPAGLAERRRRSAAGESAAGSPAGDPEAPLAVLDGRIDNLDELAAALPYLEPGSPDVELLAAGFRAWGDGLLDRLEGVFALAIWDPVRRRLLVARDPAGIRRCYWWQQPGGIVFASQLRQLVTSAEAPPFDDEYFGLFLLDGVPPLTRSPYRGILRLAPGHCLVAEDGRVRVERYWRPEDLAPVVYRDDEQYAEHFRDVFLRAVHAQLGGEGTVWSELSGGLDSSSIVAAAQHLFRDGTAEDRGFATVTMVFESSGPGDDPRYRQSLIERDGFTAHDIVADRSNVFADMPEGVGYWDEPHQQIRFFRFFQRYARMLAEAGVEALLAGNGGEIPVLTEYPPPLHIADLLRSGRWIAAWRETLIWQRALRLPSTNVLWTWGLQPLLRPSNRSYAFERRALPRWIDGAFARRLGLEHYANAACMPQVFPSIGDQWQYEKVGRSSEALFRGLMEYGCEPRYPFMARPVLELGLAIPYPRLLTPGAFKPVLRRAMKGLLPEVIRQRADKGDIGRWVVRSLAAEWPRLQPLLSRPLLAELGYADGDALREAARMLTYGKAERTGLLSAVIALEIWVRWAHGAAPFATARQAPPPLPAPQTGSAAAASA